MQNIAENNGPTPVHSCCSVTNSEKKKIENLLINFLADLHVCFCSVEKEFKVQTCVIPIDFGSQDVYPKISSAIEGLEIGILGKFR